MSTGTLVRIDPFGNAIKTKIETKSGPGLEALQLAVGGVIERVQVRYQDRIRDAYVDEGGLQKGLTVNPYARQLLTPLWRANRIVGPIVIWVPDPKPKAKRKFTAAQEAMFRAPLGPKGEKRS